MTLRASSITSITLARSTPVDYQVTYWADGVARFDGRSGQRQGAWNALVDQSWFSRAAKLARNLEPGWRAEDDTAVNIVLDTDDNRLTYDAAQDNEPADFWVLGTLIDGMCQRTSWSPLDTTGADDYTPFGAGTPMWMSAGEATATAYGLNGAVLVLAGAQASTSTYPSLNKAYQDLRSELIATEAMQLQDNRFHLSRHLLFTSPSAAASVLIGSNTSGTRAWKDHTGRTWSELGLDD
jgi:hypothetical protein